jgi:hypothetical protein
LDLFALTAYRAIAAIPSPMVACFAPVIMEELSVPSMVFMGLFEEGMVRLFALHYI